MRILSKKEKQNIIIVNVIICLILLLFFTKCCPIVPYDADDWIYMGRVRIPLPIWGGWNPTKVLPEVMMPLCGYIGAYVVYPLVGDYFGAITITAAAILTIFIVTLCICFMWMIHKRFDFSVNLSLGFEVFFLISNYVIFRNRGTSIYMFFAENMNCIFNYTVPGIVNGIAVLYMMSYEKFSEAYSEFSVLKKILFAILVYISVFSNTFHSETIAVYCGVIMLNGLLKQLKENYWKIVDYIKQYKIYLCILVVWLCALLFEMSGGRAEAISSGESLDIVLSAKQLWAMIQAIALPFKIVFGVAVVGILLGLVRKNKVSRNIRNLYVSVVVNAGLVTIYVVILGSVAHYVSRVEASWNIWFYVILITMMGIASFVLHVPKLKLFMLPVLVVWLALAIYPDGKYKISTLGNTDYATCVNTGKYVMEQIVEADKKGEVSVEVHAPIYTDPKLEWAFSGNFAEAVAGTLYNHGVIRNKLQVTTISDSLLLDELKIKK